MINYLNENLIKLKWIDQLLVLLVLMSMLCFLKSITLHNVIKTIQVMSLIYIYKKQYNLHLMIITSMKMKRKIMN